MEDMNQGSQQLHLQQHQHQHQQQRMRRDHMHDLFLYLELMQLFLLCSIPGKHIILHRIFAVPPCIERRLHAKG